MFDFAWSEIALIGVVALIAIGPKDMPVAIKTATDMIKKARRMAAEFQTHVDEMVREANLHEVRDSIAELRSFNLRNHVERAVDADGSLRRALTEDPFRTPPRTAPGVRAASGPAPTGVAPASSDGSATPARLVQPVVPAPAFIPPGAEPPQSVVGAEPPENAVAARTPAPAFIPPDAAGSPESHTASAGVLAAGSGAASDGAWQGTTLAPEAPGIDRPPRPGEALARGG